MKTFTVTGKISTLSIIISLLIATLQPSMSHALPMLPVQLTPTGVSPNNSIYNPVVSSDGRFVTFRSKATNLIASSSGYDDVFTLDTHTNSMTEDTAGPEFPGNDIYRFIATRNARYILVATSLNGKLYVRDRLNSTTELVHDSTSSTVTPIGISEDARTILYLDGSPGPQRLDRITGVVTSVFPATMAMSMETSPFGQSLSCDGRFLVTAADNQLVPEDTNLFKDIYLIDLMYGSSRLVTISANESSFLPTISCDGNHIAFPSRASNLVSNDTNSYIDTFLYSTATDAIERTSITPSGGEFASNNMSSDLSIDGRYVVFLARETPASAMSIYIRDIRSQTTSAPLSSFTNIGLARMSYHMNTIYLTVTTPSGVTSLEKIEDVI